MLTSVQPRLIIVMCNWGHLTAPVYLDTLEMGQRVLVIINFCSFTVIRE